jgi:UDP-glucose 4-epimerase
VLVTGGGGAIGSNVTDELVMAGAEEVVVLDNFVRGRRENLAWAQANGAVKFGRGGQSADRALVRRLMDGIDIVFHLAAIRITQCAEEPRLALEVLVDGTYNIFEAAVDAGVRRVVASSSGVGLRAGGEEVPYARGPSSLRQRTLYGAAKAFNEGLLRSFTRCTARLRRAALLQRLRPAHGRPRLYTEVLVRWMERIAAGSRRSSSATAADDGLRLHRRHRAGEHPRRQSGPHRRRLQRRERHETSLLELAQMLLQVMGSDLSVEHGPPRAVNGVTRRLADTSAAREQLGFEAEVDLEEGLDAPRRVVARRARRRAPQPASLARAA